MIILIFGISNVGKTEAGRRLAENNGEDMVVAVSPIYDARNFNYLLEWDQVIAIELQDTEENIFGRLVFLDENDNVYKDDEYKERYKKYYLKEIHEDIMYVKRIFKKIRWKYFIDNKPVEQVADELFGMLCEQIKKKEKGQS